MFDFLLFFAQYFVSVFCPRRLRVRRRSGHERVFELIFFFSIWITVDITIFCFRVLWLRIMISAATVVVGGGRGGR